MNKIVWMQQPGMESFAGGQQRAFQQALLAEGHQLTVQRYQPRTPWRLVGQCDWLIWSFVPTQLDVWSARLFATKQIAVVHEILPGHLSLPRLDGWCVPSESLRMQLIDSGVSHERVSIVSGYASDVAAVRPVKSTTPLIYVGGPLNASSGNHVAIWSLSILQYLHPEAGMMIHSEGDDQEKVTQLAASICAEGSVTWVSSGVCVHELVAKADIVLLPRQVDGVPDALFTACLLGKPILVSPQSSLKEWLTHDVNALLLPGDQAPAWTAAMDRLITYAALAERLGKAARMTAVPGTRLKLPGWMERTDMKRKVELAA